MQPLFPRTALVPFLRAAILREGAKSAFGNELIVRIPLRVQQDCLSVSRLQKQTKQPANVTIWQITWNTLIFL